MTYLHLSLLIVSISILLFVVIYGYGKYNSYIQTQKDLEQNKQKEKQQAEQQKHELFISKGNKLFERKGIEKGHTWPRYYYEFKTPYTKYHNGKGYFKDKEDLEKWLGADYISLNWWREL